jgi:guanylate kinase
MMSQPSEAKRRSGPYPGSGSRGCLFVVSAPSGAGKTTLCSALRRQVPDLLYSVSYTTRAPRPGEQDGKDYVFIGLDEFRRGIEQDKWAEWALVHGNYYGTSAEVIDQALAAGKDLLLDIDVQGAAQIRRRFPKAVTIFIMPPSMEVLRQRLESRGTDSRETIEKRMRNASAEIAEKPAYRYVVVNDRLPEALARLVEIVTRRRHKACIDPGT